MTTRTTGTPVARKEAQKKTITARAPKTSSRARSTEFLKDAPMKQPQAPKKVVARNVTTITPLPPVLAVTRTSSRAKTAPKKAPLEHVRKRSALQRETTDFIPDIVLVAEKQPGHAWQFSLYTFWERLHTSLTVRIGALITAFAIPFLVTVFLKSDIYTQRQDRKALSTTLEQIKENIILTKDDAPIIYNVSDEEKTAAQGGIFTKLKKGDRVIYYQASNIVVLYNTSLKKIIGVIESNPNTLE